MKDIVIIGSGGLAKEVCWLINRNNKIKKEWNLIGFISKEKIGTKIHNYPVLGDDSWFIDNACKISVVCAIGDGNIRRRIIEQYSVYENLEFPNIVANDVVLDESVTIGKGCIILPNTLLTVDIALSDFVIVNYGCTIGHDVKIDSYSTINPGVHISGNVLINQNVMVGVGANILQGLEIGEKTIIGGGATVIGNIPANSVAVGVPAKIKRSFQCE